MSIPKFLQKLLKGTILKNNFPGASQVLYNNYNLFLAALEPLNQLYNCLISTDVLKEGFLISNCEGAENFIRYSAMNEADDYIVAYTNFYNSDKTLLSLSRFNVGQASQLKKISIYSESLLSNVSRNYILACNMKNLQNTKQNHKSTKEI